MKTITREYNLYTFDELSQEAKDKAREEYNENDDMPFLSEDMKWKLNELLEESKIKGEAKVYYSLTYCQGDGAMFEGNFEWKGYNINVQHAGHYYHYNSKDISITDEEGNDIDGQIYEDFNAIYKNICVELEDYGYDVMETARSEENFRETCIANEYTFLLSGKMMNE